MFARTNIPLATNTLPQMSALTKCGIFQSSFASAKKTPEPTNISSELAPALSLIKHIKYEKLLDYMSNLKYGACIKASKWLNDEDFAKFNMVALNDKTSNDKWKETSESSTIQGKIKLKKYSPSVSGCSATIVQKTDPLDQTKQNLLQFTINEKKPFSSVTVHLIMNNNNSNQSTLNKSCFGTGPGRRVRLLSISKINFQGQTRGFKTQKEKELEYSSSYKRLLKDTITKWMTNKGAGSKRLPVKEDGNISTLSTFGVLKAMSAALKDMLTTVYYLAVIIVMYLAYVTMTQKNKADNMNVKKAENVKVTFDDAKGMEEAKAELGRIVDFLRNPTKYKRLGGKLPSGILLQGPPGTGKTLLARAVAGEANVSFLYANGSEFDELYVGMGALRIRELFRAAREIAPTVLFIDEIDAIGEKRVSSSVQPHANQTITQLLNEMDGFDKNNSIIVIGATNREKQLDEALLRPGRFDTRITIKRPNSSERVEILKFYVAKTVSKDVDIEYFAKRCVGFTGADLENLVNQAIFIAAGEGSGYVTNKHMDLAYDRVLLGPATKPVGRTEDMKKLLAYHECGHVIVAFFTPGGGIPIKVTLTPRGKTLGHTEYLSNENVLATKSDYLACIDISVGGRAAEELFFGIGKVTTGCGKDLQRATALATELVRYYGMSEKGGLRVYNVRRGKCRDDYGDKITNDLDEEILQIIQESYERAKETLKAHSEEFMRLVERLLEKGTLERDEIQEILSGGKKEAETECDK